MKYHKTFDLSKNGVNSQTNQTDFAETATPITQEQEIPKQPKFPKYLFSVQLQPVKHTHTKSPAKSIAQQTINKFQ